MAELTTKDKKLMGTTSGLLRAALTNMRNLEPPEFHIEYRVALEHLAQAADWWDTYAHTARTYPEDAGYESEVTLMDEKYGQDKTPAN